METLAQNALQHLFVKYKISSLACLIIMACI
jgi:hypothetical protein